uniref:kelch-like protein 28 n=1 Tax=Styela clava TaxID=7725 RepID=UPI00193A5B41|nr:kelch-like protein 28 [Styela clava]
MGESGSLRMYRKAGLYCDFTIKVGSEKFRVHKIILSTATDYFKLMFRHETVETLSGEVDIQGFSADTIEKVIEYMYTSKFPIDETSDIASYMQSSHMFQLEKLCGIVTEYLEQNLDPKSYFITINISKLYDLKQLEAKCDKIASNNFAKIAELEEFKEIDEKQLVGMIKAKDNTASEEEKCLALMNWTKFDEKKRSKGFVKSFKQFDLTKISLSFRRKLLEQDSLIAANTETLRIVALSFIDDKNAPSSSSASSSLASSSSASALEVGNQDPSHFMGLSLVLDPGVNSPQLHNPTSAHWTRMTHWSFLTRTSSHLQQFNPRSNEWKQMQKMNEDMKSKWFSAIALNQHIYVLVQDNSFYRLKYVDVNATWEELKSPLKIMAGDIWVVGGCGRSDTKTVEKYDSLRNQWTKMKSKNVKCYSPAVICMQGSIYSLGGLEGSISTNKVECFNLNTSTWSFISPMLNARGAPAAVECQNRLYVLGDGCHYLKTVETYDPSSNSWTMFAPMLLGRHLLNSFVFNGNIYAVGGLKTRNTMEKYDSEKKTWVMVDIPKDMTLI